MNQEEIMKNAVEYDGWVGDIENAVKVLEDARENNENIYIDFNDKKLYSLIDDRDSAYIKVVGKTYAEWKKQMDEWKKQYEKEQIEAELEALEKLPERIERGMAFIYPQREQEWKKCAIARTRDLYHGRELDNALDTMASLEKDKSFDKAISIIDEAGHSGASYGMTLNVITRFSKQGVEFFKYVNKDRELSSETLEALNKIEEENRAFELELKEGLEKE